MERFHCIQRCPHFSWWGVGGSGIDTKMSKCPCFVSGIGIEGFSIVVPYTHLYIHQRGVHIEHMPHSEISFPLS